MGRDGGIGGHAAEAQHGGGLGGHGDDADAGVVRLWWVGKPGRKEESDDPASLARRLRDRGGHGDAGARTGVGLGDRRCHFDAGAALVAPEDVAGQSAKTLAAGGRRIAADGRLGGQAGGVAADFDIAQALMSF